MLGFRIADRPVCEDHVAPFSFLADAFFERQQRLLALGPRGGGKTRMFAILHHMNSLFKPNCWTTHCGAIEKQARRCYAYLAEQNELDWLAGLVVKDQMSETRYRNNARIEILPGTEKQMSGPHPQKACADEVELWNWESWQKFVKMAKTDESGGGAAQIVAGSTRMKRFGTMQRLLDRAGEMGIQTYQWCVLDVMEPCAECIKSDCPLWDDCQGRALHASGHMKLQDVINIKLMSDEETWNSEMLCRKPSRRGLVYKQFDEAVHVVRADDVPFDRSWRVVAGVDWGDTHPTCILPVAQAPDGTLFAMEEYYASQQLPDQILDAARRLFDEYRIDTFVCGHDRPGYIEMFRQAGLPAKSHQGKVLEGIGRVRRRLKDAMGRVGLYFTDRCPRTIEEFDLYHYPESNPDPDEEGARMAEGSEMPVKEFDHAMDALRYAIDEFDSAPQAIAYASAGRGRSR